MKISPEWEQKLDVLPQGIFFTSFVSAFVVLALFLALLYKQMDLTLFALIIIIMTAGLKFWSSFSPRALNYRVSIDKPKVFPGEKIDFKVAIENHKFLPVLAVIRLSFPQSLVSGNRDVRFRAQSGILWHQKISFHRELSPARRGLYRTGSPRLITGDFFGFFPRPTKGKQGVDVLVFPRMVPIQPFPVLNRIMFGKKADAGPIHDPIRILGTRDYRSFSSARNIHWKASARHHKLQEKIFEVTEQEKVLMILEADGFLENAHEKAFERTIEVIASLSFEMDLNNYAVGFLTNCFMNGTGPQFLGPARKPGHLSKLFEMMARIDFELTRPMNEFLQKASYPLAGSDCLYFSYEPVDHSFSWMPTRVPVTNIISQPLHAIPNKPFNDTVRHCFLEEICRAA